MSEGLCQEGLLSVNHIVGVFLGGQFGGQSSLTTLVFSVDVGGCGSGVTDQQRRRRNTLSVSTTGTTGECPQNVFLFHHLNFMSGEN